MRERVLANVTRGRSGTFAAATGAGLTLALAAAFLLWIRPSTRDDSFTAKGAATSGSVDVTCLEGPSCRVFSTLVFEVPRSASEGYLSAYALGPNGERIWYFPGDDGVGPLVKAQSEPQVIPRGVTLGPPHTPGKYVVHVIISKRRTTRDEVLRLRDEDVVMRSSRTIEVSQ